MNQYIHQLPQWPNFFWDEKFINELLLETRHLQGRLLGKMEGLGFELQAEANLHTLTLDVLKSSEIEGEILDIQQVRSSIARKLGMNIVGMVPADRFVDGVVEMMIDATQYYQQDLTEERLFGWHAALFPTGRSGMHKIEVGAWRNNKTDDPMVVVSGPIGKEKIHFEAPQAERLEIEMKRFISWFNETSSIDKVLKAAIAHLWFVTIHPFSDGNGRIARAIMDMQLSRADLTTKRFYSMSTQIRKERSAYYNILETTQKGSMDITLWLKWFLECLERTIRDTENVLSIILGKAEFWQRHTNTQLNERQRLILNKLLDGFEGKLSSSKWAKITKTSQDTALRDIQDLINKGLLNKEEGGGRSTSYIIKY